MPARVAISTAGQNGQYVGTTRVPTPTASPGSTTARSFNGNGDRLLLGPSNDLGATFLALMTFWRQDTTILSDDLTSARLFTQYTIGGTRVGVGLNRSFLSLTYTDSSGTTRTVESRGRVVDISRHFLGVHVSVGEIRVYLDGRLAIRVTDSLAPPDLARVCVGADTRARFFRGQIDDVAFYKVAPGKTQNWLRYYRELVRGNFSRDYQAATFAEGHNAVTISDEGFTAAGFSATPASRVALTSPLRTEAELATQYAEFIPTAAGSGLRIGVINSQHDLATQDVGVTNNSYGFTPTGDLLRGGNVIATGLGQWGVGDSVAIGWKPATNTLSFWINGTHVYEINLPAETWTVALNLGTATVLLNSGQAVPFALPTDSPGVSAKVWSKLTTEFRQMKLAEVNAPLDDQGVDILDAYSGNKVGAYGLPAIREAGFTEDSFDYARRVGGGIRLDFGTHTAADDAFFFAVAFSPEEADLVGDKVLLESPGKWGLQILDGKLNAWVGGVQVGSINAPFTAGESYILGLARSATGRLLVWTHIGYILQSADVTPVQTSADVYVGSSADGSKAFTGRLSHLVLSSKALAAWKMNRLKAVYSWDVPDVEGAIPNPAEIRQVFELSWRDAFKLGLSTASNFVGTVAREPDQIAIEYRPVDRRGAGGYSGEQIVTWAPNATLVSYVDRQTDVLPLTGLSDLELVVPGTAILVGNEVCRLISINPNTLLATVARGCLDTVPAEHGAGTKVWFYDGHLGTTGNAYQVLDQVDVKMLSRSALAEMAEEFAPVDSLSITGRISRPYPPATVMINEETNPQALRGTVLIQWRHRNKVSQGQELVGFYEVEQELTAPASVYYQIRAFDAVSGELVHTSSVLPSTTDHYNLHVPAFNGTIRVEVLSATQSGSTALENWQSPTLSFLYDADVQTLVNTEEGEPVETEMEDANVEVERITALRANSFNGELPDDWGGVEEEEEEEEAGHLMGVKFSEFAEPTVTPTGEEIIPYAGNNTNYKMSLLQLRDWLLANMPPIQDGKSAYQLWLDDGNVGTLEDFFEAYRGFRGLNSNSARRILTINDAAGALICNWANFDEIRLRLVGDVALTFQGAVDGQGCLLEFTQGGQGGHQVTLPGSLRWNNLIQRYDITPTAGLSDKIGFIYDSGAGTYDFVTFVPGLSAS